MAESMKKLLKNILKASVTMFLIGVLLGVLVPPVAELLGSNLLGEEAFKHAVNTPVLQTGVFFGLFGGVSAVLTPAVNYLFGERATKTVTAKTLGVKSRSLGYEQAPDLSATQSVTHAHDASAAMASGTHFQDMLAAQQAVAPGKAIG